MLEVKEKLTWGEKVSFVLQLEAKAKKKEKKEKGVGTLWTGSPWQQEIGARA